MWVLLGLWLPAYALVARNAGSVFNHWFIVAWFAAIFLATLCTGFFRCPRCGKRFFIGPGWFGVPRSNVFSSRCLNCDIHTGEIG